MLTTIVSWYSKFRSNPLAMHRKILESSGDIFEESLKRIVVQMLAHTYIYIFMYLIIIIYLL